MKFRNIPVPFGARLSLNFPNIWCESMGTSQVMYTLWSPRGIVSWL